MAVAAPPTPQRRLQGRQREIIPFNGVSSPDIRNFVGALNINRANKSVFVTASHFTPDAYRAAEGSTVQVVLIDGARLAELMVSYKVGVLVRDIIELKEIDEGFFDN